MELAGRAELHPATAMEQAGAALLSQIWRHRPPAPPPAPPSNLPCRRAAQALAGAPPADGPPRRRRVGTGPIWLPPSTVAGGPDLAPPWAEAQARPARPPPQPPQH